MSGSGEKQVFFTPGPSQIHPLIPQFIGQALQENICSISHRSKRFEEIYQSCEDSLRGLLGIPADFSIFFVASATEAFERTIQNCAAKTSIHLVNGAFSKRWFETARELGRSAAASLEAPFGSGFDLNNLNIPKEAELLCLTHNETSSGVMLPGAEISKLKERYNCLVAIDIVSSAPYLRFDLSKIDCAFFSVQKGFGLPAGMCVLIVSPDALNKAQNLAKLGVSTGSYHSFTSLQQFAKKHQTPETPNVLSIFLLSKVLEDLQNTGLAGICSQTEQKAALIYDAATRIPWLKPFVAEPVLRSMTTPVLELSGRTSEQVMAALSKLGLHLGKGYRPFEESHLRIANFPAQAIEDVKRLIQALEDLK
ncbi:MAG: phosphoserine aminotransferase [Proteobacteria bacterium]|nr:MAG: phosphoserine aminotransferase [Pseudomonadota bacterium]